MKRAAWMFLIGVGCTAMVAAQTSTPQTSSSSQSTSRSDTITVTGCLQKGDGSSAVGTTGSAGAAGSAAKEASFTLTNATMGAPSASSSAAGAAGTAGTTGSRMGTTYALEGGAAESELTANAGKKVEVTGTLDNSKAGAPAGATSSAPSSASSASAAQHIKVSSVRVIAQSCSGE